MTRILLTLTLWAASLVAQQLQHQYLVEHEAVLVASPAATTVQVPANTARWVVFRAAYVWCSVDCTVTIERDGTAATATALAVKKLNPAASWVATPSSAAFRSSDVGVGTVVSPKINITANTQQVIDLSKFVFEASRNAVQNLTIRTTSITGTARTAITFEERAAPPE